MSDITIRLPDGRPVGKLRGDTFVRRVDPAKHMWSRFGSSGYAYNESVISQLLNHGCRYLAITYSTSDEVLTCSLQSFQENAVPIEVPEGWGAQRVMQMKFWRKQDGAQVEQQLRLLE